MSVASTLEEVITGVADGNIPIQSPSKRSPSYVAPGAPYVRRVRSQDYVIAGSPYGSPLREIDEEVTYVPSSPERVEYIIEAPGAPLPQPRSSRLSSPRSTRCVTPRASPVRVTPRSSTSPRTSPVRVVPVATTRRSPCPSPKLSPRVLPATTRTVSPVRVVTPRASPVRVVTPRASPVRVVSPRSIPTQMETVDLNSPSSVSSSDDCGCNETVVTVRSPSATRRLMTPARSAGRVTQTSRTSPVYRNSSQDLATMRAPRFL